jgi:histidinol-phosphatase
MPESPRTLMEFAVDVAWRAGRATLGHFQVGVVAEAKADLSPVTVADREAERIARELIESRFPHDGILGEEHGEARPDARRRWLIDPIDGTRSFVRGVPLYGVMVAVEQEGDVLVGVLHFPALGETVHAALGEGCWWDGRRALVSSVDRLDEAVLVTTDTGLFDRADEAAGIDAPAGSGPHAMAWSRLRSRAAYTRTWGDCYGHALVATGRAEAMLDPVLAPWDAAALRPILEEAGGVFSDWHGKPTHRGGSGISTNAALAREIRDLIRLGA